MTAGDDRADAPPTQEESDRRSSGDARISAELAGLDDGTDPFAAAVRATRMPMVVTNPRQADNPIVFANDAFCRLTGYGRHEILGHNCRFLQGPATDADTVARIRDAIAAAEPIEIDIRNHRKDGSTFWNRLLIAPVRNTAGRVDYFFASQFDVTVARESLAERTRQLAETQEQLRYEATERQRVEDAFRQARKMEAIGQLTGGIAHDFNNMLQAISGSLELIHRRIDQDRPGDAVGFVDSARRTVERASALTNRLLAFARRQSLQPKPVMLDALIEGIADLFRQTLGVNVAVELDLQDGSWSVLCDASQLENALLNLVINARDAMPRGGRLVIATRNLRLAESDVVGQDGARPGEHVEISVRDTGVGMDDVTRDSAFDPFFTTKPLGQGTGLGLSQLHGFVRQTGGVIGIESALGKGTTVRIALPRHQPGETGGAASPVDGPMEAERHGVVLLVEDEEVVRSVAAEHLRDLGYHVLEARNGVVALALLQKGARIDLLVTDVGLPGGLNGRQLADHAREGDPALPVLFITGFAGNALKEQLAPGMEVMGKPFALDTLVARVRLLLPRHPSPLPG